MKNFEQNINSSIDINASKAAIFSIISDHEGTHQWVKQVKKVSLLEKGTPKNGKGAIRQVNFKPLLWKTVQERIVVYDENSFYHYKIISKMPGLLDHLGVWKLEDGPNNSVKVSWEVKMIYKRKNWLLEVFGNSFKKVQEQALLQLKKNLESNS